MSQWIRKSPFGMLPPHTLPKSRSTHSSDASSACRNGKTKRTYHAITNKAAAQITARIFCPDASMHSYGAEARDAAECGTMLGGTADCNEDMHMCSLPVTLRSSKTNLGICSDSR